jgi:hypothetical protein
MALTKPKVKMAQGMVSRANSVRCQCCETFLIKNMVFVSIGPSIQKEPKKR